MIEQKIQDFFRTANSIFLGKEEKLLACFTCVLAGGHILIEDLPGVGKTTLARMLSKLIGVEMKRVQFTNDLLPSDIIGTNIFNREKETFEFKKGPIFTEFLLADELNRATPKSQSALLQVMEEHLVSIDGKTFDFGEFFMVMATQNPYQLIGTYQLPESQLDRFAIGINLGLPDKSFEKRIILGEDVRDQIIQMEAVFSKSQIIEMRIEANKVQVSEEIADYLLEIFDYGRGHLENGQGLSVRASRDVIRMARAFAYIQGRQYVIPEDIQKVVKWTLPHRIGAQKGVSYGESLILELLQKVNSP